MRRITAREYRRRVFNKALLESLGKLQCEVLNGDTGECPECDEKTIKAFTSAYYNEELDLANSTVAETRAKLAEANEFVQDIADASEEIADEKMEAMQEEDMEVTEDQEVELSDADQEVINQIFEVKKPDPEIDTIRDATVKALVEEDRKAQEIKDSIDIAQSKVEADNDPDALEETVKRLNAVGPTSFMNAIMNHFSTLAVKDINESGRFESVQKAMHENRDLIKTRSALMYSIFETASVMGIRRYGPNEIKNLAYDLYYGR